MNNISLFLSRHQIQLVTECRLHKFCPWLALFGMLLCSSRAMKRSVTRICMTSFSVLRSERSQQQRWRPLIVRGWPKFKFKFDNSEREDVRPELVLSFYH